MNKVVVGHRTATAVVVDQTGVVTGGVTSNAWYDLQVVVNGRVVTVLVNGQQNLQFHYAPRFINGQAFGLNQGLVGVGSNNSRGTYDNFTVQDLPPQSTFDHTDDSPDAIADLL